MVKESCTKADLGTASYAELLHEQKKTKSRTRKKLVQSERRYLDKTY